MATRWMLLFAVLAFLGCSADGGSEVVPVEKDAETMSGSDGGGRLATFGSGCFWCSEALFSRLEGVLSVTPGYSGGTVDHPTYEQVCSGTTGHAEVVQIRYDPAKITYTDLLEVFFKTHDPTTLNQQGADVGTQYRSVIFTHDEEQRATAEAVKKGLGDAGIWSSPIVTEIVPFEKFWPAENYHQDYYANNPNAGYCQFVIRPKIEKLEKVFAAKLRKR